MLIGTDLCATSVTQRRNSTLAETSGAYAALASGSASAAGSAAEKTTGNAAASGTSGKKNGPTTEELLKELRDYIKKGPIVAMREKILKSMGLTEDDLKALPPEKQAAIEDEIARKIKEMLLEQQELAKTQQAAKQKIATYGATPSGGVQSCFMEKC